MREEALLELLLPVGRAVDEISTVMPEGSVLSISEDMEEFAYNGDFLLNGADVRHIGERLVVNMRKVVKLAEPGLIALISDLSEVLIEEPEGASNSRGGQYHFTLRRDASKISFTQAVEVVASTLGSE